MPQITPFTFDSQQIRVQVDGQGNPWFNANDVCAVLGFGNPYQVLASHVDEEDLQKLEAIDSLNAPSPPTT